MNAWVNWGRAFSIAHKEYRHILRDPFTLALALGLPVAMVAFFGIAIDLNVRHVNLVVSDRDHSRSSRQLADMFRSSGYFDVRELTEGSHVMKLLDAEKAKGVLVIEPEFGRHVEAGEPASAQVAIDGGDNSVAGVLLSYLHGIEVAAQKRLAGRSAEFPINVHTRFLFNPELNSQWFVVPGLAVVVVGIFSVLLTSLTVAREWENGSMELLLSTPVRPLEIVIGKLSPYIGLNLLAVLFIHIVARWGFAVPFQGNPWVFGAATLLFLATTLSQGLLISVTLRQQQLAMQIALITGQLPSLLLSGFLFPVESMPPFFRYFTAILAPRWFMVICRGIYLKDAGMRELALPLGMLVLISVVLMSLAVRKFKTDLEME